MRKFQDLQTLLGEHSIFFYLLLFVLGAGVLLSVSVGGLFLLKRTGEKRANRFFAVLLITIGLTLLHNMLYFTRFYEQHPRWYFLPIYFTLAFPTLLFYYVKFNLYPVYKLRWTDMKHFILPIGQWLFFAVLFLMPVEYKSTVDRNFYNPFYGAFEQCLYLGAFFAYLYFAYRYVRHKRRRVRGPYERKKVIYLAKLLQILFILFCGHTVFVVGDFLSYEILGINLRAFKPHLALGMLSFAALVYWLSIYGIQVLLWGRRVFLLPKDRTLASKPDQSLTENL